MQETKSGVCPYAKKCGGCDYQGVDYEEQLKKKQKLVQSLLGEFGKPEPIIGMKQEKYYRNKVHAVFDRDKKGNIICGVYEKNSHRVVDVESCMIEDQKADAVIRSVKSLLKSFKIKTYDEDSDYGLLRHVLVRTGHATGQILVVLVLASPVMPSKNNFVKALLKLHPDITSIVINVNNKRTSMVLGEKESVIYGKGYIEDVLCGLRFRISPKSFYQINPQQTEILYHKAMEYAGLRGNECVVDAYSGIGTIGLIAAKSAGKVISVELNRDAVRDAVSNARINDIKNIQFYQKDASDFLVEMAAQKAPCDVVFMDPPRAGSTEEFMSAIVTLAPKRVVYVSCDPQTLARDLKYFTKKGYEVKKMCQVDMFPFTAKVETVVLLSHKTPDSHINVDVEFGEGKGKIPTDKIQERADKFKPKDKVTYKVIKEYIEEKYGFKVHTAYIAEVKRSLGLPMYEAPNAVEELKNPRKHPTEIQVEAIKDALKYFAVA